MMPLEIEGYMTDLRNQIGKKVSAVKKDVVTDTPSLQGSWTPVLGEALRLAVAVVAITPRMLLHSD